MLALHVAAVVLLLLQVGCSGLQNCASSVNWLQTRSANYAELTEFQNVRVSSGPGVRFVITPLGGTARNVSYEVRFSG